MNKPSRIIFQPSFENNAKLRKFNNDTGMNISDITNVYLDNVFDVKIQTAVKGRETL